MQFQTVLIKNLMFAHIALRIKLKLSVNFFFNVKDCYEDFISLNSIILFQRKLTETSPCLILLFLKFLGAEEQLFSCGIHYSALFTF